MLITTNLFCGALSLLVVSGEIVKALTIRGEGDSGATDPHHFHLTLETPETKLHRRSRAYINDTGYITTDQSQATVFYISNDQLVSNGQIVSASPSDPYIVFATSSTVESISTVWTRNGNLEWFSSSFAGDGIARYCQRSDSRVYLVLQSEPSQCEPAVASPIPTATTAASTTSTSSSTPEPTADGIRYYGYTDPNNNAAPHLYNGNSNVDIAGIAQDINFYTNQGDGTYTTFPGQLNPTSAGSYSVVYQGYFLAPVTSSFTLTSTSQTDNELWMWYGEHAFSGWNDGNYDAMSFFPSYSGSITFNLSVNETVPITIVWANVGGPGSIFLNVFTAVTGSTSYSTAGFFTLPIAGDGFSNSGFKPTPT